MSRLWLAVPGLWLLWPAIALADPGIVVWPEGAPPSCSPIPWTGCTNDSECPAADDECIEGHCAPAAALLCATNGVIAGCPAGSEPDVVGAIEICAPDNPEYCGFPRDCYLSPGSIRTLGRYPYGDCDGDGIANSEESGDAQICAPERRIGVVGLGGVCRRARPCGRGPLSGVCPPEQNCRGVPDEAVGNVCTPQDEPLFCCTAQLHCAARTTMCTAGTAAFGLCSSQDFCPGLSGPAAVACFVFDGAFQEAEAGDCDVDGRRNSVERSEGTPACERSVPAPDAGSPDAGPADAGRADAGSADAGPDAGSALDAGASVDAAVETPLPRTFRGGGGCACEASARGRSPDGGWLALLALLFLAVLRRPRGAEWRGLVRRARAARRWLPQRPPR